MLANVWDFGKQTRLKFCEPPPLRHCHHDYQLHARCDWGLLFNYYKGIKSPVVTTAQKWYTLKTSERIRDGHNWSQRVTMGHKHQQWLETVSQMVTTYACTVGNETKTQGAPPVNQMINTNGSYPYGYLCSRRASFCFALSANRNGSIAKVRKQ